jgi:hypothetical protein
VGRRSSWAFGAFHKARLGMFENIFLGIVANFLTDFLKKVLRWHVLDIPQNEAIQYIPPPSEFVPDFALYARRALNQEHRAIALTVLTMVLYLAVGLFIGSFLPLLCKDFASEQIHFATTRLAFINAAVSKSGLAVSLTIALFLPSFLLVQFLTKRIAVYIHNEWSNVSRERVLRIFMACTSLWLIPYAGMIIFFIHPQVGLFEALLYPALLLGVIFAYELQQRT